MSKQVAEYLARQFGDGDYFAKKIRGQWLVWSHAADHVVEFDLKTIAAAAQAEAEAAQLFN